MTVLSCVCSLSLLLNCICSLSLSPSLCFSIAAGGEGTWNRSTCNCTSYLISGLNPETEYEIRVILIGFNNCTRLSTPPIRNTTLGTVCMCLSHLLCSLLQAKVKWIRCILYSISFSHLAELVVEVMPSVLGTVTSGMAFELSCQLDTGEDAPMVMWRLVGVAVSLAQRFQTWDPLMQLTWYLHHWRILAWHMSMSMFLLMDPNFEIGFQFYNF